MNNNSQIPNPYPTHALPGLVCSTALELQAKTQTPFELVAPALIAAMSLACQNSIVVRRPNGMQSCCSAAVLLFALSGDRKTTVDREVMQPFYLHEAKQADICMKLREIYDAQIEVWNAERKALWAAIEGATKKKGDACCLKLQLAEMIKNKPQKPRTVKLIYNNATPQALLYGLFEKFPSAGLMSDEAGTIFDGKAFGDLGMLNKLWDGSPITVDRRTSDSFTVQNPRLTMCLMVQPAIFQKYLERHGDEARSYGFFARFLVAAPISNQGTRFIYSEQTAEPVFLPQFHARITEILERNLIDIDNGNANPKVLEFSPEAKKRWIHAYNTIESMLAAGGPLTDIRDFASKAAENIARLAAVFHFFVGEEGDISYEMVDRASCIVTWHTEEAKRLFGAAPEVPQEEADARLLLEWMVQHGRDHGMSSIMKNQVRKNCPYALRKDKRFDVALDFLMKFDQVRQILMPGKGKALVAYIDINPVCFTYQ
jgi:hypothetical protein